MENVRSLFTRHVPGFLTTPSVSSWFWWVPSRLCDREPKLTGRNHAQTSTKSKRADAVPVVEYGGETRTIVPQCFCPNHTFGEERIILDMNQTEPESGDVSSFRMRQNRRTSSDKYPNRRPPWRCTQPPTSRSLSGILSDSCAKLSDWKVSWHIRRTMRRLKLLRLDALNVA